MGMLFRSASHRQRLAIAGVAIVAMAIGGCGVPGPQAPADTYGLDFSMPQGAEVLGAIVFCIDGLNAEVFQEMLSAGELPAIKKYFADRGLYAPKAVAGIPSVTLANLTTIVTGRLPGHHGIVGVNWFDRNQLLWRDYETIAQKNTLDGDYTSENLYEQFPDQTTFSIFFQPHRRATKFIENWTSAGPPFFFGWYEYVDRLTLSRFNIVADVARQRRRWPAVTIAYMLAPDFRAYGYGVQSAQYRQALEHTDRQIGRLCRDLEKAGILERLQVVLVSDHGMGQVERHCPIEQFLGGRVGLNTSARKLWESTPFERRLEYYSKYSAVTYGSGDRYWAVCLRKPAASKGQPTAFAPWPDRPSAQDLRNYPCFKKAGCFSRAGEGKEVDLIETLRQQEAVDAVAYSVGKDVVRLQTKGGEVEFSQLGGPGSSISYRLIAGQDPLGWSGKVPQAALDGQPMSSREWLKATIDTEYPDTPAQIVAYFRSRLAGDIVLFASPGWDFASSHRAGHGGLRPADMCVPLLLAGPGIPQGRIDVARTADLAPTLLKLLGRPIPPGLDGQSLVPDGK